MLNLQVADNYWIVIYGNAITDAVNDVHHAMIAVHRLETVGECCMRRMYADEVFGG